MHNAAFAAKGINAVYPAFMIIKYSLKVLKK